MKQMKDLRAASAYLNADTPVIVKQGDKYFRVKQIWPDTNAAAMGRALYLEIEEVPDKIKTELVIKPMVVLDYETATYQN